MRNRNMVVICLDTVRKDYFDSHAHRLTSRADISFSQCRAPSSWTVPSHASLLTGELPHKHGSHAYNASFEQLSVEDTFLSEIEHRAIGVSANPYLSSSFGAASLFDEFVDVSPAVVFPDGLYLKDFSSERSGLMTYIDYVEQALEHDHPMKSFVNGVSHILNRTKPSWIPRRSDDGGRAVVRGAVQKTNESSEPYFLFLNFMDAHAPFSPTLLYDRSYRTIPQTWSSREIDFWDLNTGNVEPYKEDVRYYRELYAASIEYLDRLVSDLVDTLIEQSRRETTFIITADHGENLVYSEDDYLIEHKGSLSEALLHVPFVVINPPDSFNGHVNGLFSLLDLGPLVGQLLGGDQEFKYTDCVPAELIGLGSRNPPLSNEELAYWDRTIRCSYRDDKKYIWDSIGNCHREFVDSKKSSCRGGKETVVDIPEWADVPFSDDIYRFERCICSSPPDKMADRLKDLGYL